MLFEAAQADYKAFKSDILDAYAKMCSDEKEPSNDMAAFLAKFGGGF